jgi:hypothetical protein
MNRLEVNKYFFSRGGIIGRWDFFIKCAECMGLYLLGAMVFVIGVSMGKMPAIFGALSAFAIITTATVFYWFNAFKRLRDIRGTSIQETPYQIGLFFSSLIPYLNFIPLLCLFFMEGQSSMIIQSDMNRNSHVENDIQNDLAA